MHMRLKAFAAMDGRNRALRDEFIASFKRKWIGHASPLKY